MLSLRLHASEINRGLRGEVQKRKREKYPKTKMNRIYVIRCTMYVGTEAIRMVHIQIGDHYKKIIVIIITLTLKVFFCTQKIIRGMLRTSLKSSTIRIL